MDLVLGQYLRDCPEARITLAAIPDPAVGNPYWKAELISPAHNLAISSGAFTLNDALDYLTSKLIYFLCCRESARANEERQGKAGE